MRQELHLTTATYTQERHCCLAPARANPFIELRLDDGGGGEYMVMNAHEFAFDSITDIYDLCNKMVIMLTEAKMKESTKPIDTSGNAYNKTNEF